MTMADYPYGMQLAVAPLDENNIIRDGEVWIFDPSDAAGVSPLALKDLSGLPLVNPLRSNAFGNTRPFVTTSPQVKWKSGAFEGLFDSFAGMRNESIAAAAAAEESRIAAVAAGTDAASAAGEAVATAAVDVAGALVLTKANGSTVNAGNVKGGKGDKGDKGDKGLDGSNVLPTDAAIKQAITTPGTETAAALSATYATKGSLFVVDTDHASLETALAATATGGTLEVRGTWSRSTTFTINKTCTVRFSRTGSITTTDATISAITVAADDVELLAPRLFGTGSAASSTGAGIRAVGTLADKITGLRILAPKCQEFTQYGIYTEFCDDFSIERVRIENITYAGIMMISCIGGSVSGGVIKNITQAGGLANGYGVAASYNEAAGIAVSPRPQDITIENLTVSDVPGWEGIDTHAGIDIRVLNNKVYNCKFGIAIVPGKEGSTLTYAPTNFLVRGNTVDSGRTDGAQTYGINVVGCSTGVGFHKNVAWATGVVADNIVKFCGHDISTGFALGLQDTRGVVVSNNHFDRPVVSAIRMDYNNMGAVIANNTCVDAWANASALTTMVYAQSGFNTAHVSNNRLVRGSHAATLVDAGGLRIGSILGTVLIDGNNDFSAAAIAYTGLSGNGVLRFDNRGIKGGYVSALPTLGVWQQGSQLLSTVPAAAGSPGWVCTTAGGASSATWAATTAYTAGAWVKTSTGKVLECVTAGTSSAGEPNPSTLDGTVTEGTVTWVYRSAASAVFKAMPNVAV